jgi:hypothetical protein
MTILKTIHEKKSLALTTLLLIGVLGLLFFFGLRYLDPPIENGILIAFGSEEPGNVSLSPAPPSQEIPFITEDIPVEKVDDLLVSEASEVVIPKETAKKEVEKKVVTEKEETLEKKTEPQKQEVPKVASDATKAALANILGAKEAKGSGTGTQEAPGNRGLSDGSLYANSLFGSAQGSPNGIGFGLAGRSLVGKGSVTPDCNEEGRVVVAITVDRSGQVILADAGVRGTTNNAPCLLTPAKATALMYRWAPDSKAPERQIGYVVIYFKLGQSL